MSDEYFLRRARDRKQMAIIQGDSEKLDHYSSLENLYEGQIAEKIRKHQEEVSNRVWNAIQERKAKGLTIMGEKLYPHESEHEKFMRIWAEYRKQRDIDWGL
ncbi:MAG: hypothetical protein V1678_05075 [Candidatus Aenigmatarchaeota archaeon]